MGTCRPGKKRNEVFLPQQLVCNYSQKNWNLISSCIFFDRELARHQASREGRWKDKMRSWMEGTVRALGF